MSSLDELIAKSSIGAGLANIRENGIEAELKRLDQEIAAEEAAPEKKRRKKSTSPTARTLAECKRRGWIAGVVERHIPFPKPQGTKIDLFGVIDLVVIVPRGDECTECHSALDRNEEGEVTCYCCGQPWRDPKPPAILAIQATGGQGGVHAARRAKILAEPRAKAWVDAGGQLEIWSWSKRGSAGKRKIWQLRVETYDEMLASAGGDR